MTAHSAPRRRRFVRAIVLLAIVAAGVGFNVREDARAGATTASVMAVGPAPVWGWPVAERRVVLHAFAAPATRYSSGHRGIDIAAGTDIRAPADGVVFFSGFVVDRPVLSILHPGDIVSSYEPVESELTRGSLVREGQVIGRAIAGHCSVACIHVGVRRLGQYVSPLVYFGGLEPAILLPTRPVG